MKKLVTVLGSIIIAIALMLSGLIVYNLITAIPTGTWDQTDNDHLLENRPNNWQRLVDEPIILEDQMDIINGSTATIPITAELFRQFYEYNAGQIHGNPIVQHDKTHASYLQLINREKSEYGSHLVSLIFVTPPSQDELAYAQKQQVELDLTPIALDGFVFITHKDNPIDSLTIKQIQGIYSGKITNWRQVGGENRKILAYQRNENSGSQTAMEEKVMAGRKMVAPRRAYIRGEMSQLVDGIAEYDNGPASIGYSYHYYLNYLYKNANIKVIKVGGVAPTDDNLVSGAYPFTTEYLAVMRADEPKDSPARKLRDFLVTDTGQAVIKQAGYCPVVNS
ncbi:MAG: substrate-binding domain-containing protein [Propionibacteriaceae bacterium]|nr:substrate-binding domain-containing protein [Propionibacteriaceae bacterium]